MKTRTIVVVTLLVVAVAALGCSTSEPAGYSPEGRWDNSYLYNGATGAQCTSNGLTFQTFFDVEWTGNEYTLTGQLDVPGSHPWSGQFTCDETHCDAAITFENDSEHGSFNLALNGNAITGSGRWWSDGGCDYSDTTVTGTRSPLP